MRSTVAAPALTPGEALERKDLLHETRLLVRQTSRRLRARLEVPRHLRELIPDRVRAARAFLVGFQKCGGDQNKAEQGGSTVAQVQRRAASRPEYPSLPSVPPWMASNPYLMASGSTWTKLASGNRPCSAIHRMAWLLPAPMAPAVKTIQGCSGRSQTNSVAASRTTW